VEGGQLMKKFLLLGLVLLAACDSPTVPERFLRDVYDFRLRTPEPVTFRWELGSTVKFFVVADNDAARTQYLRDATVHGVEMWNQAALYGEVALAMAESIQEADVVVEYSHVASPVELSDCFPSGGLAVTTFCLTESGTNLKVFPFVSGTGSNVKFVLTVRVTPQTSETDVRRLVTHEIGHVLGIAQHSPKQTDLMFGGALLRDDPSPADRATLQVLYHTKADITP
jgi:predicted Zn-dependent protease